MCGYFSFCDPAGASAQRAPVQDDEAAELAHSVRQLPAGASADSALARVCGYFSFCDGWFFSQTSSESSAHLSSPWHLTQAA